MIRATPCLLMVPLLLGCNANAPPAEVTVTGTVRKGGKPLEGVQVFFQPSAFTADGAGMLIARGVTDPDGRYRMQTVVDKKTKTDTVAAGKYRVLLSEKRGADRPEEKPRIPDRYGHFDQTPLAVEFRGPDPLTFDVDLPE